MHRTLANFQFRDSSTELILHHLPFYVGIYRERFFFIREWFEGPQCECEKSGK